MTRKITVPTRIARSRGLSLVELMIGITLGMIVVAALLALYVNITTTNNEMAKMNRQIENGRFAIQLLQEDIIHAGYWGTYVPNFDDLSKGSDPTPPIDTPNALPDPCLAYSTATWNTDYTRNLVGIPVQAALGTCGVVGSQKANTDVLVVRHAQTCVAGAGGNCDADTAGKVYFQSSRCAAELSGAAQDGSTTTIKLSANASSVNDFYVGARIRIISGAGGGQSSTITGYDGATKVATVNPPWNPKPDNSSQYAFGHGYVLANAGFIYSGMNCATPADKRKFVSNIYYVRNFANFSGDGIPTLMRSSFDLAGGTLAHQGATALIEGIEGFRVEYGIDDTSDTGENVDNSVAIDWADDNIYDSPKNRGDGIPDRWVNNAGVTCTGPGIGLCDAANVVAVRIHVLARNEKATAGYTDSKTYQLGDITMGPFGDGFKRHVFSSTVRLANPSGRRETP
jgi:type II secretory pathway pseudopilin PulG